MTPFEILDVTNSTLTIKGEGETTITNLDSRMASTIKVVLSADLTITFEGWSLGELAGVLELAYGDYMGFTFTVLN